MTVLSESSSYRRRQQVQTVWGDKRFDLSLWIAPPHQLCDQILGEKHPTMGPRRAVPLRINVFRRENDHGGRGGVVSTKNGRVNGRSPHDIRLYPATLAQVAKTTTVRATFVELWTTTE